MLDATVLTFDSLVYSTSDALVIIDEITIDADNRAFKSFKQESVNFFVYHRHYNCDVLYFTQQWDAVDKKIRNLTQSLYRIKKSYLFPFVTAKAIFRTCDINDYTWSLLLDIVFRTYGRCSLLCFTTRKSGSFVMPFMLLVFGSSSIAIVSPLRGLNGVRKNGASLSESVVKGAKHSLALDKSEAQSLFFSVRFIAPPA